MKAFADRGIKALIDLSSPVPMRVIVEEVDSSAVSHSEVSWCHLTIAKTGRRAS